MTFHQFLLGALSRMSPRQGKKNVSSLLDDCHSTSFCDDENGATTSALHAMILRDPNASRYLRLCFSDDSDDDDGIYTTLSRAVHLGASQDVVRAMCKLRPDSVRQTSRYGWTALHYACYLQRGPGCDEDEDGRPARRRRRRRYMHWGFGGGGGGGGGDDTDDDYYDATIPEEEEKKRRFEVTLTLACLYPDAAMMQTLMVTHGYGFTPLHLECIAGREADADVVELLSAIRPLALELRDSYAMLPLHRAVSHGTSFEVVRILAESYPLGMMERDKDGYTPLGIAERHKEAVEVQELLKTMQNIFTAPSDEDVLRMLLLGCRGRTWRSSLGLILDARPWVVHLLGLGESTMAEVLERVGREGSVRTMFEIVRESMGLFETPER